MPEVMPGVIARAAALLALVLVVGCGTPKHTEPVEQPTPGGAHYTSRPSRPGDVQRGYASWYGADFDGKPTASGERFRRRAFTAAHRTLPMGTRVKVVHARTGRSVVVRINDRGPYSKRRIIDVSEAAARQLHIIDDGVAPVTVHVLSVPGR
jgi:rare lipoprotein A